MPNIIINNYCNQKCEYCFAEDNMNSKLKKDMSILTFIKILKYLRQNNDPNIRILWWEPLLSSNIKRFLWLSIKWWFNTIIFSNINIKNSKIREIFDNLVINTWFRINCNINNLEFYSSDELENIGLNLEYLKRIWVNLILWYNIYNLNKNADFIFELAEKYNIQAINLKITNSSLWSQLIIDNSQRDLGIYLYNLIQKYHQRFFIEFSCGLDQTIFLEEELEYIKNYTNITLRFGCDWNIWKFDINTNGTIFKCFPLQDLYKNNINTVDFLIKESISIEENLDFLSNSFWKIVSHWECSGNSIIKYGSKPVMG